MVIVRNLSSASCCESSVSLVLKFVFFYSAHNFFLVLHYILALVQSKKCLSVTYQCAASW